MQAAEATHRAYGQLVEVATTRVELADRALRDLLDLDDAAALELAIDLEHLPTFPAMASDEARRAANDAPQVVAATSAAEAAEARVRTERARMLPSLTASFNYTYANPNSRIFPQTTTFTGTWDAGVQLSWSLDGALLAQGRLAQRRALAEESALAAEEAEENAGRAAIAARGAWLAALSDVEARESATASAATRARTVAERRAAGLATDTDLRDAEAAFLAARLDLVDAIVDVHLAHARYANAIGEGPELISEARATPVETP